MIFSARFCHPNNMIPKAESDRTTKLDRFVESRTGKFLFVLPGIILILLHAEATFGSTDLADDHALIVGSDGVVYSVDLDDASVTAGVTLTGDVPTASYSALEADPTTDLLYLSSIADAELASVRYLDGATTSFPDYGVDTGAALTGLVRVDSGELYLSYTPPAGGQHSIARVDTSTGVLSDSTPVMLGATNTTLTALVESDDTVYAFAMGTTDELYTLDVDTGTLTSVRAATGEVTANVVGADSTSDGTIYLMSYQVSAGAKLYRTDPEGTTTLVGTVTLPGAAKAEHLAIATLLSSERPEPEPEPSPEPEPAPLAPSRDDDDDDDAAPTPIQTPAPAPATPAPAPAAGEEVPVDVPDTPVSTPDPEPQAVDPEILAPDDEGEPVVTEVFPLGVTVSIALGALLFFLLFFLVARFLARREPR